jgi:hypothetical protein
MSIDNPEALAATLVILVKKYLLTTNAYFSFKDSGEFDHFQNELLAEFQKHVSNEAWFVASLKTAGMTLVGQESYSTFKADIGDFVRQRLAGAQMLHYLPQDKISRELTQEVEGYVCRIPHAVKNPA